MIDRVVSRGFVLSGKIQCRMKDDSEHAIVVLWTNLLKNFKQMTVKSARSRRLGMVL